MTDFFISYTGVDTKWAEWIAYVLEEEGFSTVIQAWDFRPGSNFVLEMQKAAASATRTIMVLSPDYLQSQFASPEWAAAFAHDPKGIEGKLLPVMVRDCVPTGLLTSLVQIRVLGLHESVARQKLIDGVKQKRAKPTNRPAFPGAVAPHAEFPGGPKVEALASVRSSVLPTIKRNPSDLDKRRFVQAGFHTIRDTFRANLDAAAKEQAQNDVDFQLKNETDFRAEIFVSGESECRCRIWLGGMHSENNICFSEGNSFSDNSCNEIITLADHGRELIFHAMMAMGAFSYDKTFDTDRMSPDQVAAYLWMRFVHPLSQRR